MTFVFSLFPATLLAVLGYVVFYCSIKVDGAFKTFGRILAIWLSFWQRSRYLSARMQPLPVSAHLTR